MKNLILSLVAALCCSASLFAEELQEELVATLNHKGTLTAYYGKTAFAEAMENAENGDEITLSGGFFYANMSGWDGVTYNKAVTIRGTGCIDKPDKKTKATIIGFEGNSRNKDLLFDLPSKTETDAQLYLEGVAFGTNKYNYYDFDNLKIQSSDGAEAYVSKCYAKGITSVGTLMHIYSSKFVTLQYNDEEGHYDVQNCIIQSVSTSSNSHKFQHCFLWSLNTNNLARTSLQDCIIFGAGEFPYGCNVINCLFLNEVNLEKAYHMDCYTDNIPNVLNKWDRDYYGGYNYTFWMSDFTLQEQASSKYPSSDGTEIGIYGGNYPFTYEIALPFITNFVLGNRTSAGKLPVTIEVK